MRRNHYPRELNKSRRAAISLKFLGQGFWIDTKPARTSETKEKKALVTQKKLHEGSLGLSIGICPTKESDSFQGAPTPRGLNKGQGQ